MAITDYNYIKNLEVVSVSGTPTISRALCIKVTSGTGDETGTGEIAIDWTNVSSQGDIGVFDENDNLLDYHFESFDATAETAVIWVYRSWVQDGTVQAKLAYGNGPGDNSVVASTVFDKESNLQAGYLLNESSGDALDVTSNNNDGTVNGATQDADGIVGPAYSFDGTDDYVSTPLQSFTTPFTIEFWIKADSLGDFCAGNFDSTDNDDFYYAPQTDNTFRFRLDASSDVDIYGGTINTGTWYHIEHVVNSSGHYGYVDGSQVASGAGVSDGTTLDSGNEFNFGDVGDERANFDGKIDNLRYYSTDLSSDEISAIHSATKSSPDFFSQQAAAVVVVDTDSPTNVTGSSATLNGTLESLEGNSSLDVYFEYGTDTSYGSTTAMQTISSVPTSFSADISGLTALTTYHYRAVATDGTNYWYGGDESFYTADLKDLDETQADFAEGTLTDVEADAGDYLRLADTDVLSFDGTDDYVDTTFIPSNFSTLTLEVWVKTTSEDVGIFTIYDIDSGNSIGLRVSGDNQDPGLTRFFADDDNNAAWTFYGTSYINDGNWHHIAGTFEANTEMKIYVDGALENTLSISIGDINPGKSFFIARDRSLDRYLNGNISDARVWGDVRTETEIQNNKDSRLVGDETSLLAYYKLDEGSGDTATDSAGSNDGTINGATWEGPIYDGPVGLDGAGNRLSPQLDLSSLGTYADSLIEWTETLNSQTITIETRLSLDGGSTWDSWQTCASGSEIPNFSGSEDLSNALLECRQNLSTSDATSTPELNTLNIAIAGTSTVIAQATLAGQGDLSAKSTAVKLVVARLEGQGNLTAIATKEKTAQLFMFEF